MELNLDGLAELGWRRTQTPWTWDKLNEAARSDLSARWKALPEEEKRVYRMFAQGVAEAYSAAVLT